MIETNYRYRLKSQLEEAYGKVLYTYETQQEAANLKLQLQSAISILQIVLTSLIAIGFVGVLFPQTRVATCLSALLGGISLCLNIYSRSSRNEEQSKLHSETANKLWNVVQDYISLLVDFDNMSIEEIKAARNSLQTQTNRIYLSAPRTSQRAYKRAQDALKSKDVQTFEDGECKKFLPAALRDLQVPNDSHMQSQATLYSSSSNYPSKT